jgi:DNA (cytosine-5)-methyltransferase 1
MSDDGFTSRPGPGTVPCLVRSPRHDLTECRVLDLFAGAGGWEEGLRNLGLAALGVESDPVPCATAEAAGHDRLEADVASLQPTDLGPVWGLIASPPCQAWSIAGKRLGRRDRPEVIACAGELAAGFDSRARHLEACADERSLLTVEPLRWALALRPRWIALEQVPAVLELWELFATLLKGHGYRCATGILSAERFGVPQVRRRAFLIASLDGPPSLPTPTHRSSHPRRHEVPEEERDLPDWVSMAEALGWGEEPATLRNNHTHGGRIRGGEPRSLDRPSFTVVGGSCTWKIEKGTGQGGSARRGPGWARHRPATTVLGEPRVFGPGCWPRNGHSADRVRRETVRVTVEQASVLQGFRHDYPWQGPRTARFRQIGNAVCPPVARVVLAAAMEPSLRNGQVEERPVNGERRRRRRSSGSRVAGRTPGSGHRICIATDDVTGIATDVATPIAGTRRRRPGIPPAKRPGGDGPAPKSKSTKETRP